MTSFFQYIRYRQSIAIFLGVIAGMIALGSCKKFSNVPPPNNQLTTQTLFKSDATVLSALASLYTLTYITNNQTFQIDLSVCPENSADETHFYTANSTYDPFYQNNIDLANGELLGIWSALYKGAYVANSIISGVQSNSTYLTDSIQKQAIGESKFMRAFCYFYLVNLYGDVPLVLTTDAINTTHAARASKDSVYVQIVADLLDAQSKLRADYASSPTKDRVRPNKYAATALLARVYLYLGRWSDAEAQATTVINQSSLYGLQSTANLRNAFLKDNTEAIFQMDGATNGQVYLGYNNLAWQYIYYNTISKIPWMVMTDGLVNAFEPGDVRYSTWVRSLPYAGTTYYYPYKYRNMNPTTGSAAEAYVYLRLAEQYLIRAEARAQQNNASGAQADLNVIRNRAGLSNTTAATQTDLLLAVEKERRIEFFCEFGHRWYDLKRTNRADAVLGPVKPGWKASAALYPIPQSEISNDPNLSQNTGY
jgi:hypothetical protein